VGLVLGTTGNEIGICCKNLVDDWSTAQQTGCKFAFARHTGVPWHKDLQDLLASRLFILCKILLIFLDIRQGFWLS